MLCPCLRLDHLRTNNVANAVCSKNGRRHEALLSVARNIGHADGDDQADSSTEEPRNGISNNRCGRSVTPLALPNDGAAGNDGKTRQHQHDNPDILDLRAQIPRHQDNNKTKSTQGKLKQDRM